PAAVNALRRIEDLFRRLEPVEFGRRLAPETFGVAHRTRIDLVITACPRVHRPLPEGLSAFAQCVPPLGRFARRPLAACIRATRSCRDRAGAWAGIRLFSRPCCSPE